ncbi:RNA-binding S4 domain-containing protein [Parasulfuritortus cantonensis]|uniref:RNA-binding S4 domain-containing protein n=1 Tax=Parasulfuritortus cantonensis TaxID=2528202 RepID=A0A4R1B6F6_9PROT|nr:RNA-binding S4 domain-containing protein [Parasulfuritortus cantonensis]TCJ11828.1 RNA-binding S4 domain-containing protein [Parasulfuritortus cantonensis]
MDRLRIDKWLWAARFFKTRSLASQAVDGGRVRLNGERAKPSKEIRVGDRLEVHIGEFAWLVDVLALSDRRGPAEAARTLYQEDQASRAQREAQVAERRLCHNPGADLKGRPTKRDRRLIHRFTNET